MQCLNCGFLNQDNLINCQQCNEPLTSSQMNPQAYQEPILDQTQQAPPPVEMQFPPAGMQQPPPGMPPPPPGIQTPAGYPSMYGGSGSGYAFQIPEAGRSGVNEILMGQEGINEAPLFTCGFLGAILAVISAVVLLPFRESKIYAVDVLINRGFWPYTMIYTFWLGIIMVIWKYVGVQKMKGMLKKDLIPPHMSTITPATVDGVLQNVKSLCDKPRSHPLVYRLWMGLLIFKQTSQVERVDAYCTQQSDAEIGNMDASFQFINFCLWLQPIFGFLGTVQGLGLAMAGFGDIAGTAMEIDTIKNALASVTGGLSTAFDTTFLGLISSVVMMTVITYIKNNEDAFLANVDVWIKENMMPKLKAPPVNLEEEGGQTGEGAQGNHFKKIIEETFKTYIQNLEGAFEGWKEGFTGILGKLNKETGNMNEQFKSVEPLVTDFRSAMNEFSQEVKQTSEQQKGLVEAVDSHFAKLEPMISGFQKIAENLDQERKQLDQQMKVSVQELDKAAKGMVQQLREEGSQFLSKADQFQQQANHNTTEMSAAVGRKLSETGQEILGKFQQQIQETSHFQKEQGALIQDQVNNLSNLSENLTRNMGSIGDNLLKKFENQTSGMETLQKNLSNYLGQFDRFIQDFQNHMKSLAGSQAKNMENMSSKTMETFKNQLSEWFQGFSQEQSSLANNITSSFTSEFNKVGRGMLSQFGQYAQKQEQNSSQIMQEVKGLQQSFGNLANQLGSAFNKLSQDTGGAFNQNLQKISELIQQCQKMTQETSHTSGQNVQGLSAISTQIQALVNQQKEVTQQMSQDIANTASQNIQGLSALSKQSQVLINQQKEATQVLNQHANGLSTSEATYKKGIEELGRVLVAQQQLIAALNEGVKHQVQNNSGVKDALNGINAGIESIKPSLLNLVESIKSKN